MGVNSFSDRRQWPRYSLDFPVRVEGRDASGAAFSLDGTLRNISARGALGNLPVDLQVGSKVRFDIAFPFNRLVWLSYEGVVVRIEQATAGVDVAVRFTNVRPSFIEDEPKH